jgi:hypothetical protein
VDEGSPKKDASNLRSKNKKKRGRRGGGLPKRDGKEPDENE